MEVVIGITSVLIFISLLFSIFYSVRSRQAKDPVRKGLLGGKLNVSMGAMLILMSIIQLLYSNESTLRIVLGAVFLLLGLFNLFAGLRNVSYYRNKEQHSQAP
ncbi:hypothetical protein J40TS1_26580 [Paenibacillus montaniterrae]|uniref:YtpI-like protein n=1 Tax=Paenibacillus montaniterrae TaxID=429341 RepID=A0A920CXK5_9BACL|nr:YtpI family protein [Paenibacillus montaniterrae]GIP17016.1 hypothetical protein J40TS1_26580 [Paenibacillus montaniterrae]